MTNAADKNEIIAYARDASGNLAGGERFETGGRGSGGLIAPLGSQGALTLSQDRSILFAVNAGSPEIFAPTVGQSGPGQISLKFPPRSAIDGTGA